MFVVTTPKELVGYLVGRNGGQNAEAIRRLVRARGKVLGWPEKLDVQIRQA